MVNQRFSEDKRHHCTECGKLLEKGKAVWLELIEGTSKYYFYGIPKELLDKGKTSQGWHAFGSNCAKKNRID